MGVLIAAGGFHSHPEQHSKARVIAVICGSGGNTRFASNEYRVRGVVLQHEFPRIARLK